MNARNRLPLILLVASLLSMVLVGGGLFLWLDDVKASEERQLYANLDNGARRIQTEIALEFAVTATLFTYAVENAKSEAIFPAAMELIPGLYKKWLWGTRFPGLIDTVFIVDKTEEQPVISRYDVADERFLPDTGVVSDLDSHLSLFDDESGAYRIVAYPGGLALVMPIERYPATASKDTRKRPVHVGHMLILLDPEYFAREVVAHLFEKYLGPRGGRYSFAVVAGEQDALLALDSRPVDRVVPLTSWISTDDSLLGDLLSPTDKESAALQKALLSVRVGDLYIRQWFGLKKTGASDGRAAPVRARDAGNPRGIDLYIWHSAGSIEERARTARNRRLLVGYSVFLGLALLAIVYYLLYRRARCLRDREHEFVATVTHELRTPVSGVKAVADNLAEGIVSDPERIREYGRAILDHGRRLGDLIDQVLLYAGLSGSTKRVVSEPVDLDRFVRDAVSRVASMPRARLIVHLQPGLHRYAGDKIAIETVITNLVSNAAKHAGDTATVTVNVYRQMRRARSWLVIRVSDTGSGIPKRELGRVQEPFYRGEASRTHQIPGTGLGLSLVNRIVRTYGGRLSIDSMVGRGTTVTVRLPFERDGIDER